MQSSFIPPSAENLKDAILMGGFLSAAAAVLPFQCFNPWIGLFTIPLGTSVIVLNYFLLNKNFDNTNYQSVAERRE